MPTVGSLFSGIGGLDLGLERVGWEVRWQVENDDYCRRVLDLHWPSVAKFGDVHGLTGDELEPVDLIAGGFPCQPVSVAGRRRGQDDERWLWPEFARVVRVLRPRFVLVENVPGLLVRGMGDVLGDLARIGYDAEWARIPAAAVGAPHLRYRIFIVAYRTELGWFMANPDNGRPLDAVRTGRDATRDGGENVAHAESKQSQRVFERGMGGDTRAGSANVANPTDTNGWQDRSREATQQGHGFVPRRICGGTPTRDDWWATEPDVGRVAHGIPSRVDRLRGLGNAVVPQVAEWIGRRLMEALDR